MTNSWEELNSPRSTGPTSETSPASESNAHDAITPAESKDPFKAFLAAAVGIVVVGGGLMAFGGLGDQSPQAEVAAAASEPLPFDDGTATGSTTPEPAAAPSTTVEIPQPSWANLLDSEQASIYRLYVAAFGRAPDRDGFDHWTDLIRSGKTLEEVAAGFTWTQEFQEQFGARQEPRQMIEILHRNVLGRPPTAEEVDFWLAQQRQELTVSELMVLFAESGQSVEATGTNR